MSDIEPDIDDELLEVRDVQAASHAQSSKNTYLGKIYQFLEHMIAQKEELLSPAFVEYIKPAIERQESGLRKLITKYISYHARAAEQYPFPLDDSFGADDMLRYLSSCKKKKCGSSHIQGVCSAIRHLFVIYNREAIWDSYAKALSTFKRGAKNQIAKAKQAGQVKVQEGKVPMPFLLYHVFALALIVAGSPDAIFAHTFLLLGWNLMCRSKNTAEICIPHMRWIGDALGFVFGQQKNDQEGDDRDWHHVYANPLDPAVCPILSLGIWFLCFPPFKNNKSENRLFPGDSQSARFGNFLRSFMSRPDFANALRTCQLCAKDLGTHSTRKGSATYCCGGTTDAPFILAISNRGGWSVGGIVQERYIKPEKAQDQKIGRTACGLNVMSADFAILPPFWKPGSEALVNKAVALCFPDAPESFHGALQMFLASVVYHEQWLKANLPSMHPVLLTPVFHPDILSTLKEQVICRRYQQGDPIRPTGISPQSQLIADMDDVKSKLFAWRDELSQGLEAAVAKTISGITKVLEERAVGMNTVTRDGLDTVLQTALAPLTEKLEQLIVKQTQPHISQPAPAPNGYRESCIICVY